MSCKNISAGLFSAREHALTFRESFTAKFTIRPRKFHAPEGGYCHICAIQVCAAVKGMVCNQFTLA